MFGYTLEIDLAFGCSIFTDKLSIKHLSDPFAHTFVDLVKTFHHEVFEPIVLLQLLFDVVIESTDLFSCLYILLHHFFLELTALLFKLTVYLFYLLQHHLVFT